jgi:serine/threonine protein kinase
MSTMSASSLYSSENGIHIIKSLANSKFPVYLIRQKDNKLFALKLFRYNEDGTINKYFENEARFSTLSHQNIISFKNTKPKQRTAHKDARFDTSWVIMEYAPFGNLTTLLKNYSSLFRDEKLVRTYFHQLMEGLEYLHNQGVAHLDIKLENLLIGEDFKLKISDFDLSYKQNDKSILGKGTRDYRAPELKVKGRFDPFAADIYSAGIVLFILMTSHFPYIEDNIIAGYNLEEFLKKEDPRFWEAHMASSDVKITPKESFKTLFMSMVNYDPIKRATIEEVKESEWYKGPIYSEDEIRENMAIIRSNI